MSLFAPSSMSIFSTELADPTGKVLGVYKVGPIIIRQIHLYILTLVVKLF